MKSGKKFHSQNRYSQLEWIIFTASLRKPSDTQPVQKVILWHRLAATFVSENRKSQGLDISFESRTAMDFKHMLIVVDVKSNKRYTKSRRTTAGSYSKASTGAVLASNQKIVYLFEFNLLDCTILHWGTQRNQYSEISKSCKIKTIVARKLFVWTQTQKPLLLIPYSITGARSLIDKIMKVL